MITIQNFFKVFLLTQSVFMAGCVGFRQTPGDYSLVVQKDWVKSTLQSPHTEYRKVNGMEPMILDGKIIQGNGVDGVVCVEKASGKTLWAIKVRGGVEGGAVAINDRLFFGGNDGQFYSASISTGQVVWTFPTRTETLSQPTLSNGVVYFLAGNNILYALDAATGQQQWLYSRVDNQAITVRGGSSPLIYQNYVITGFSDGYLVALDTKSGVLVWEKLLNRNIKYKDLDSNPVLFGEALYILGYESSLYSVKASNGELLWKVDPGGVGSVALFEETLFYSTSTGEVRALDKKTGALKWKYKLKEGIASSPIVFSNKYLSFVESQGSLRVLKLQDGMELSHFNPGRGGISRVVYSDDNAHLYFISNESNLYSLKIEEKDNNEGIPWLVK